MMTFSNKDLKQLKEDIEMQTWINPSQIGTRVIMLPVDKSEALLARLEAAEAVLNRLYSDYHEPQQIKEYKAWRKSKGE